jgi:hypothetical protein
MSEINYTNHFLNRLEDLYSETEYQLRYEKGNFKSGYCLLNSRKIAIVNKYYTLEGKINCLIEMLREIQISVDRLSPKNRKFYLELTKIADPS